MALALRSPELVASIVSVDNAPADKVLSRGFAEYVRGMKRIQEANVTRQAEADKILEEYEEVSRTMALLEPARDNTDSSSPANSVFTHPPVSAREPIPAQG